MNKKPPEKLFRIEGIEGLGIGVSITDREPRNARYEVYVRVPELGKRIMSILGRLF